jgi:hypothetical protein
MASTTDWLTNVLKTKYLDQIIRTTRLYQFFLNYLEQKQQVIPIGKTARIPVVRSWAESLGAGDYNSVIPEPLDPATDYFEVSPKFLYGSLRLWFAELAYADQDWKAFVNAQTEKVKGIANALRAEKEIWSYGDGGATPRAVLSAASHSGGVVTCTVGAGGLATTTKLLRVGMPVDFKESNGDAITSGSYLPIQAILGPTQFTVAGDATFASAAADAYVFHANNKGKEVHGLLSLIGTNNNTVHGVNRTTAGKEWYKPNVWKVAATGGLETTTGRPTSPNPQPWEPFDLYQAIEVLQTVYQANPASQVILTTPSVRAQMIRHKKEMGEVTEPTRTVDTWPYKEVEFDGLPLIKSHLFFDNAAFIPDMSTFAKLENTKWRWDEEAGGMWKQAIDQATGRFVDAKDAYGREIFELAVFDANKNGAIYDMQGAYTNTLA